MGAFSLQKIVGMHGSWLVRGQVNMADEAELYSTSEVLVVQSAVRCCRGEELGPFYWPVLTAGIGSFSVHLIHLLSILLRCNGFIRIQKAMVDQTGSRPPDSDHDLFLVQSWLWEVFWSISVQPPSWPSLVIIYNPLFIAHHNLIKRFFLVVYSKRRWHFKMTIFSIFGQLMRHPLIELFRLSSLLQMLNSRRMVEWMLRSLADSHVVVRGSALMMALSCHCQRPVASHNSPHLQGSCLLCTTWTNVLYVH